MTFHYITANNHLTLIIDGPNPLAIYVRMVIALGHKIDIPEDMRKVDINPLFEKTAILVSEFKRFCDCQSSKGLWQLYSQIRNMPEHTYFMFLPEDAIKDGQLKNLMLMLFASDCGRPYQEVQEFYDDYYNSSLMQNYQVVIYRENSPEAIGNSDRSNRVCRLCGRSESDGATFKMKAHAISELLGNKNLILHDECDACNDGVLSRMECSVATFFKGLRVMLGVRGKTGMPSVNRPEQKILNNGAGHVDIQICADDVQLVQKADGNIKMSFVLDCGKFVPQHIYRMLSKYVISVLPDEVFSLSEFEDLLLWIRGCQKRETGLPLLMSKVGCRQNDPSIFVYKRKANGSCDLPLFLVDFSASGMRFLYELPFVEKPNKLMSKDAWKRLFEKITVFGVLDDWNCEDFSSCDESQLSNTMILEAERSPLGSNPIEPRGTVPIGGVGVVE